MARTKTNTQNDTKTRTTSWPNRHLEKLYFLCFSGQSMVNTCIQLNVVTVGCVVNAAVVYGVVVAVYNYDYFIFVEYTVYKCGIITRFVKFALSL